MNRDGSRAEIRHQGLAGELGAGRQVDRLHQDNQTFVRDLASGKERLVTPKKLGALRRARLQPRRQAPRRRQPAPGRTSASSSSAWTARRIGRSRPRRPAARRRWSKDGKKILCQTVQGHIHQVGVDGKNWEQLTFGADVQHDARYSPDGTMILFCRAPAPEGPWQICVQKLDGDEEEFVQITKEGSNLLPDWHESE